MKRTANAVTELVLNFASASDRTCKIWETFRHVKKATRTNDGVRVVVDVDQARRVLELSETAADIAQLRQAVIKHLSKVANRLSRSLSNSALSGPNTRESGRAPFHTLML